MTSTRTAHPKYGDQCPHCKYQPLMLSLWHFCPVCGHKIDKEHKDPTKLDKPHRRCSFCNTCPICHDGPFYNYYVTYLHIKREHAKDCSLLQRSWSKCKDCTCDKGNENVDYTPCTCHYRTEKKTIIESCLCDNHIIVSPLELPPAMSMTHFIDYYQLHRYHVNPIFLEQAVRTGRIPAVKFEGIWRIFEKGGREWLAQTLGVEELDIPENGEIPLLPDPDM